MKIDKCLQFEALIHHRSLPKQPDNTSNTAYMHTTNTDQLQQMLTINDLLLDYGHLLIDFDCTTPVDL